MLLLACLVVYNSGLALRGYILHKEILKLYKNIDFVTEHDVMKDALASPFRSHIFSRVVVAPHESEYHRPRSLLERVYESYVSRAVVFSYGISRAWPRFSQPLSWRKYGGGNAPGCGCHSLLLLLLLTLQLESIITVLATYQR